jgi:hypothetical protein
LSSSSDSCMVESLHTESPMHIRDSKSASSISEDSAKTPLTITSINEAKKDKSKVN